MKRQISLSNISLVLANMIPLGGVLFFSWDPVLIFGIYILETVVVGIFNIVKMLSSYHLGDRQVALKTESGYSGLKGYALIPFFLFHYFFFVYVQSIFFFVFLQMGDSYMGQDPFNVIANFKPFVMGKAKWAVLGLFVSHGISYLANFMLNGKYRETSIAQLMFRPYKRIFVQQFVVILGAFVFTMVGFFHHGAALYAFVVLFVVIKVFFDLRFHQMVEEGKVKLSVPS